MLISSASLLDKTVFLWMYTECKDESLKLAWCLFYFYFYSPMGGKSKQCYFDYVAKLYQRGIKVTAKNIKSLHEDCQQFTHNGKQLKRTRSLCLQTKHNKKTHNQTCLATVFLFVFQWQIIFKCQVIEHCQASVHVFPSQPQQFCVKAERKPSFPRCEPSLTSLFVHLSPHWAGRLDEHCQKKIWEWSCLI